MPNVLAARVSTVIANAAFAAAETVVVGPVPLTMPQDGGLVRVSGGIVLTTGATVTALTPRIRRGLDATGAQVGPAAAKVGGVAAGVVCDCYLTVTEVLASTGTVNYVLTLVQTGAGGNGNVLAAWLDVEALSP